MESIFWSKHVTDSDERRGKRRPDDDDEWIGLAKLEVNEVGIASLMAHKKLVYGTQPHHLKVEKKKKSD